MIAGHRKTRPMVPILGVERSATPDCEADE
jgi:hypothetical protein